MDTTIRAPRKLGSAGRKLWKSVTDTFDFVDEPHKLELLEKAARTADKIAKFEALTDELGDNLTSKGSAGQLIVHPYVTEIRNQTKLLESLLASMKLPATDEELLAQAEQRSRAGKTAASARWHRQRA